MRLSAGISLVLYDLSLPFSVAKQVAMKEVIYVENEGLVCNEIRFLKERREDFETTVMIVPRNLRYDQKIAYNSLYNFVRHKVAS